MLRGTVWGGVKPCKTFSEDDNLIIKGNNLLALASLLKRYEGKVKCIYIDPPYNTGNDSFNYNDNFNHSTWLTFMKNRLELARKLLRDDGVIFVQCDDNEQAYLKVLMDEIFGKENFVNCSAVVTNRGGRDYGGIAKTHEYLLIYSKKINVELYQIKDLNKKFQYVDENGGFNLMELRNRNIRFNKNNRPNLYYPFYINPNNSDENDLYEISLSKKENFIELYPLESQGVNTVWRWGKEKAEKYLNTEIKGKKKQNGGFMIVQKNRLITKRQRSVWDEKEFVNERGTEHIKQMLGMYSFSYPKSEFLIQRILELSTDKNDIVLDFHLGSGTTAAVAHKMGRRYIGIEQMDYIKDITVERLKKVIEGEQGGISKAVNWQGGGSFVYCELLEDAQYLVNRVQKASGHNISQIKKEIYNDKRIVPYITKADLQKAEEEFEKASLEDKKKILLSLIDKNKLYVNYSEMEDEERHVSEEDKVFTRSFYEVQ